ncbi:MAG: SiaB family protein kinase [Rhodocyclaceae bacterium]|jgi:hypothetical protein|nr:hypothetical protein [Rhodocyclaceae bacterium]MCL4757699.1 SiaB family protein kinase [Rhodocyclaceae bacterium]
MNTALFSEFCNRAAGNGVLFYYSGEFSQNVVHTLGDAVRRRVDACGANGVVRRKVFSAFVEMAQNIVHYAEAANGAGRIGAVAVGLGEEGRFSVLCASPVRADQVERIRSRLDPLRSMTLDQIRQAYREQLRNEAHAEDEVSRGAGLGFLTLAREASEPIEYRITYTSGDHSRAEFYLRAVI